MQLVEKQLLALLKAGLWKSSVDSSLFEKEVNWKEIIKLAKEQTVVGIVYDGMLTLPQELRPSRIVLLQWTNILLQLENNNLLMNEELWKLFANYETNSVSPILMKGQGLAYNYPQPLHRQCGDIDVYVGKSGFDKANKLLVSLGGEIINVSSRRVLCKWNILTVENHCKLTEFGSPWANSFLNKEMKQVGNSNRKVKIGEYDIRLLPLELDVMFVLVHLLLHFIYEGIGLRQICDWACMLHRYRDDIDKKELERLLRGVGCFNGAKIVGAMMVKYLGFPKCEVPFMISAEDYKNSEWLMDGIIEGGNFGFYSEYYKHKPKNWLKRKLYAVNNIINRCRKYHKLAPAEAWCYPFRLVIICLRIRMNRLMGKEKV